MSDYDNIESLQQQGIIDSKRIATIKICLVIFFHACICAVLMSGMFAIWLDKQVHLNSLQIGEILGLKTVVAIFYKPIFGWLLDKTQLKIYFIMTIAVLGLAAGPFFQFVYKPLLLSGNHLYFYGAGLLGGVYFGYVVIAGGAAVFSYCGRYIEAHGSSLDKISATSFGGWLVMGFALTILYTFNPTWGFYLASFSAVCMIVTLLTLKVKPFDNLNTKTTSKKKIKIADLKLLLVDPRFYVLLFFSSTIIVAVYSQSSQMGRYGLSFWPERLQTFGLRLGGTISLPMHIGVFVLIAFSSKFIKKLKPSRTLLLLSLGYSITFASMGFAGYMHSHMAPGNFIPSLVVSFLAMKVWGLVNPFANLIILSYITVSFNKKLAGVAFLVGFNFVTNLVSSAGHAVVGELFETQGWGNTYFELAGFILICTIILAIILSFANSRDRKRVMNHLNKESET